MMRKAPRATARRPTRMMSEPVGTAGAASSAGLTCPCGRVFTLEVDDLFRLAAGERLTCLGCGSDVGIDLANAGEGGEALRQFCDGIRNNPGIAATFGASRSASISTAEDDPAQVGRHRPGPRYAVKRPGQDGNAVRALKGGHAKRSRPLSRD